MDKGKKERGGRRATNRLSPREDDSPSGSWPGLGARARGGICGETPFLMMVSAGLEAAIMGALRRAQGALGV